MTAEPTGQDLDRAIAELMGWHCTTHVNGHGGEPCLGHLWRAKPEGGTEWMEVGAPSFSDAVVLPSYTKSVDALQAPEQVLRDVRWELLVEVFPGGSRATWVQPHESVVRKWSAAPTEPAARAAAVYGGLKAWKEANGG